MLNSARELLYMLAGGGGEGGRGGDERDGVGFRVGCGIVRQRQKIAFPIVQLAENAVFSNDLARLFLALPERASGRPPYRGSVGYGWRRYLVNKESRY